MSAHLFKIGYILPIGIILSLYLTYLVAPNFYVSYILEESQREFRAVEIVTVVSAAIAGGLLCFAALNLWRYGNCLAAGLVGIVAAATLFFAGEEIGWGQIYFQWTTPMWWKTHFSGVTDLHSTSLPIHELGGLFVFVMFFLLPFLWKIRTWIGLPATLEPAIAEGPVIFTIALAAMYRELKSLYYWLTPLGYRDQFYNEFLWGLNEHKEMLVAIALLFYALFRREKVKNLLLPS